MSVSAPTSTAATSTSKPPLLILYGSQTGCSQEVAERLARSGTRRGFVVTCLPADSYDRRILPQCRLAFFICSTTGQGEPPDNMKNFYRFLLRRDLPQNSLSSLKYSTFGLGDSSYPLFNAIARRLHQRVHDLGATPLIDRGLGDDQAVRGLDEAFDEWQEELWKKVEVDYPQASVLLPPEPVAEKYQVEIVKENGNAAVANTASTITPPWLRGTPSEYTPVSLRVLCNDRLTPLSHFQDVRHIEFEIPHHGTATSTSSSASASVGATSDNIAQPSSSLSSSSPSPFIYQPGDVLLIHPRNLLDSAMIRFIETTFDVAYERDSCTIRLKNNTSTATNQYEQHDFPHTCTIRDLFEVHLDILGTPRSRWFFEQLSHFSTTDLEKERLLDFVNPLYYADFSRYCLKEKRTYLEVLQDFPNSRMNLSQFISMVPRLQPRQFSIASSLEMHPGKIQILLAILDVMTPFKRKRTGVCSNYLASLNPKSSPQPIYVSCWIRKLLPGSLAFHAPANPDVPLILIGPGTGIAPFRAMVQERAARRRVREESMYEAEPSVDGMAPVVTANATSAVSSFASPPPTVLPIPQHLPWPRILVFFGNRNHNSDYFYRTEWEQYSRDGICDIQPVFSRDEKDVYGVEGEGRVRYVQHVMSRPERVRQIGEMLIAHQGQVMVAGSANQMPKEVRETILRILQAYGDDGTKGKEWTEEQAKEYLKLMEKNRRYLVEAW